MGLIIAEIMSFRCAFLAVFFSITAIAPSAEAEDMRVLGTTLIHPDGTRTESVRDQNTRQLEQRTYDANDVLMMRRLYQLNDRGLPVMGNLYDGAGNLTARSQSFFDAFGRLQEERLSNLQGEVFQQVLHEYGADGTAKKPQVRNYKVSSPTMRPAMVNFTHPQPAQPQTQQPAPGGVNIRPPADLNSPQPAPTAAPAPPQPEPEKPKGSFFKRLFKGKDGDAAK